MAAIRLVPLAALGVVLAACVGGNERRAASPDAPPDVSRAALRAHLTALEAAARRHGGTRAVGTPGYGASVDYVVRTLRAAGYGPRLDRFRLRVFRELGPPTMTRVRPSAMRFRHRRDFLTVSYSGSGSVTAAVQPVDVRLPPGRANSSTSGCERADFTRFPRGRIALLQRGRCFFSVKARNAQAAGARAVLVFNEGQAGRRDVLSATLGPGRVRIPVLGLSYGVGRSLALAARRRPVVVRVAVRGRVVRGRTANVIAELAGRPDRVVMLGAHLDSVPAGPGMNDNGSGVALVLEAARELRRLRPEGTLRFAFWSAEEVGLLGSAGYVSRLGGAERDRMVGYLNFDMVGSPNFARLVYGTRPIEAAFRAGFHLAGLSVARTSIGSRSDHAPFARAGVPVGGLFTGADGLKTPEQQRLFGGRAGRPYDACYHRPCDRIENVSLRVLEQAADAAVVAARTLAE